GAGAPPLLAKPGKAVRIPALWVMRLTASETEPELPRQEPERHPGRGLDTVCLQRDPLGQELPIVPLEAQLSVAGALKPALRIVFDVALERQGVGTVCGNRRGEEAQAFAGCVLGGVIVAERVVDARRHVVDSTLEHDPMVVFVRHPDRVVLLRARTTDVDGVESPRLAPRQDVLAVEKEPAFRRAVERGIGNAGTADELMELEREERLVAPPSRPAPVALRRRRDE